MAFGSNPLFRFTGEGVNYTHTIEVYQDGVSPTTDQIEDLLLNSYPEYRRGSQISHNTKTILHSKLKLEVVDYDSGNWGYLYDRIQAADPANIRIDYLRDGALKFRGLPFQFQAEHPANLAEYTFKVTANDGFRVLKNSTYDRTSRATIDTLVSGILGDIGHDMPYRFFMDWKEDNASGTFLPQLISVDPNYYRDRNPDESALEYLKQVLFDFNFQLWQENGRWIIRQINNDNEEASPTSVNYYQREPNSATTSTGTVNMVEALTNADLYAHPKADLAEHTPDVKIRYNVSRPRGAVKNNKFLYWENGEPADWTILNGSVNKLITRYGAGIPINHDYDEDDITEMEIDNPSVIAEQEIPGTLVNFDEDDVVKLKIRYRTYVQNLNDPSDRIVFPIAQVRYTSAIDGTEYYFDGSSWTTSIVNIEISYTGTGTTDGYVSPIASENMPLQYDITPPENDRGVIRIRLLYDDDPDNDGTAEVAAVKYTECSLQIKQDSKDIASHIAAEVGLTGTEFDREIYHGDVNTWVVRYPTYIWNGSEFVVSESWGGQKRPTVLANKIAAVNREPIGVLRGRADMSEGVDLTQRWSYDGRTYRPVEIIETLVEEDVQLTGYTIDPDETGITTEFLPDYGTTGGESTAAVSGRLTDVENKQKQVYENTQITTTTSALSGEISSIPINAIGTQILDTNDPVSVIDKNTGLVYNFNMRSDQAASDTSLAVESKALQGTVSSGSFVVFTGNVIKSAIVKLDDAIALKAPSVFVDADVMQDADWNGSVDSNGNITAFASDQTSPNPSWAITGQGHFEFTNAVSSFRYDGGNFQFLLREESKVDFGGGSISNDGIYISPTASWQGGGVNSAINFGTVGSEDAYILYDSNVADFIIKSELGINNRITAGRDLVLSDGNSTSLTGSAIYMSNLPTTQPANSGQLWNDGGVLKIVP